MHKPHVVFPIVSNCTVEETMYFRDIYFTKFSNNFLSVSSAREGYSAVLINERVEESTSCNEFGAILEYRATYLHISERFLERSI